MTQTLPILCALAALLAATQASAAEPRRYAIIVGSNHGNVDEPVLRFAQDDASGLATVLTSLGGFDAKNLVLLRDPSTADVQSTFLRVKRMVADDSVDGSNALLLVYFSGHGDAVNMHLGGTLLSYHDFIKLAEGTQTGARVVIVDACRSGEATLQKGVKRVAPFLMPQDENSLPSGSAILASASAEESAQESPRLAGSFFTHYLITALRGAADFNADGKVSLNEAFQYSADQTAASTANTVAGIQHATYRYQMRGRADLILSRPSAQANVASVTIGTPGEYTFQEGAQGGKVAFETRVTKLPQVAWLPAGHYYVQRRTSGALWAGDVVVAQDRPLTLSMADLEPVQPILLANKGTAGEVHADVTETLPVGSPTNEISAWGGTGGPTLPGFAMPGIFAIQGSHHIGRFALDGELKFIYDQSNRNAASISLMQGAVLFGARYLFIDNDAWRLSAGLRVGPGLGRESITTPDGIAPKLQLNAQGEALLRAEFHLGKGFFLGVEGGADVATPATASIGVRATPRVALGIVYVF